jgi:hypothetical protein
MRRSLTPLSGLEYKFTLDPWRASSPLYQGLGFWHTQVPILGGLHHPCANLISDTDNGTVAQTRTNLQSSFSISREYFVL